MAVQAIGVFCEDIREEKSGQLTLVGILPDNINIPKPPKEDEKKIAIIPRLAIYVRIHSDPEDELHPMQLKLLLPDGNSVEIGKVDGDLIKRSKTESAAKGLPVAGIIVSAAWHALQLREPGLIRAVLEGGGETRLCAVLNIVPA